MNGQKCVLFQLLLLFLVSEYKSNRAIYNCSLCSFIGLQHIWSESGSFSFIRYLFAIYENTHTQPCDISLWETFHLLEKCLCLHENAPLSIRFSFQRVWVCFFRISSKKCVLLFGIKTMFVSEVFSKERVNSLLHVYHMQEQTYWFRCVHVLSLNGVYIVFTSTKTRFHSFLSVVFAYKMKNHHSKA